MGNRAHWIIPVIVSILIIGVLSSQDAFGVTSVTDCGDLNIAGETYVLANDITSTTFPNCITIKADNITFDGNGFTITNGGGTNFGVFVDPVNSVTVKNVEVVDFVFGIVTNTGGDNHVIEGITAKENNRGIDFRTSNTLVTGNTLEDNDVMGIFGSGNLAGSTVSDNTLTDTGNGIQIIGDGISITDNTLNINNIGIALGGADDNTITGNSISQSIAQGIRIEGTSHDNLVTGNTIIDHAGSAGIIIFNNAFDNTISDNTLSGNSHGVRLSSTTGNIISDNTISSNFNGVLLQAGSNDNIVFNNNFESNTNQIVNQAGATGNIFDFPAPVGGNFYDNFDESAEGCDDTSPADGYCDVPFVFSGGQDNLPWTLLLAGGVPIPDTDGDGLLDNVDNCPLVPNADQADSNNNGIGGVCDPETLQIANLQSDLATALADLATAVADLADALVTITNLVAIITTEITQDVSTDQSVASGNILTIGNNAIVNGNIFVNGGTLNLIGGVTGSVVATPGSTVNILQGTVDGNVLVDGAQSVTITSSSVNGKVEVTDSQNVSITGNTINGDLTISGTPPASCTDLPANTVNGNIDPCP